jgi:citronellol/citronellal dehydrogenase
MANSVAFITGGSRGIGKAVGLKLAAEGWDIVVAAKTTEPHPKLEGTIFTAAEEMERHGVRVLPVRCDVTDMESVEQARDATLKEFGRVDAVINNAGALWWLPMTETPMKRFDLMMAVNARGAFAVTQAFLPQMIEQKSGHVIVMSPPIRTDILGGKIGYFISKFGMTLIAHGIPQEYGQYNIHGTALWPRTLVESQATINHAIGERSQWRKPEIIADATWEILEHPELCDGKAVIDEAFLREVGYTDFSVYDCVEGGTPMVISD